MNKVIGYYMGKIIKYKLLSCGLGLIMGNNFDCEIYREY